MLADTEAYDEYFAKKYTDGDTNKFVELCNGSVEATDDLLDEYREDFPDGQFTATSFLAQFGHELIDGQLEYEQRLKASYDIGRLLRVDKDIERRSGLYEQMYGGQQSQSFLATRTIRTMAQYLCLGEIIGRDPQSCVIVHDTVNASMFQDFNQYVVQENQNMPTPPVIKQAIRVYS